jgi:hypothetical protein
MIGDEKGLSAEQFESAQRNLEKKYSEPLAKKGKNLCG